MLRREFTQSGHAPSVLPPAPKPPPKPAANKREEAEERRAFAKSEQAAGVIPSKPAVVEELSDIACVMEPEKPKTFLERIVDWGKNPATWWNVAKEDETVKVLKNTNDVPLYLPVIRGITPYIDEFSGPLKTILMDKRTVRALGRAIGDITVPWTLGIGLGLTVLPNLVVNIRDKKPWNDTVADVIVDAVGFGVSEIAGSIVGGTAFVSGVGTWGTLGWKIAGDLATSVYWDTHAQQNNWNGIVSNWLDTTAQNVFQNMFNSFENSLDTTEYPPVPESPIITPLPSTPTPAAKMPQVQPTQNSMPKSSASSTPNPAP